MTTPAVSPLDKAALKREVTVSTIPLQNQVKSLAVMDALSYTRADSLLKQVCDLRSTISSRIGEMTKHMRSALSSIKLAMSEATTFEKELDTPLVVLEGRLRGAMKVYQLAEAAKKREAEEADRQDRERLAKEAERLAKAAEAAKTEPMRRRLEAKQAEVQVEAATVRNNYVPALPKVANSTTRATIKVRVTDLLAFIRAVAAGDVPLELVEVDERALLAYARGKQSRALFDKWPGVEAYEDIGIVRKGN